MGRLVVATLNILNLADRWEERLPLLLADTAALRADLLALQEVVYVLQQDRLLGAGTPDEYAVHRGWAGRPEYGNSLLVRRPLAIEAAVERLDLGRNRAAARIVLPLPGGSTLQVTVTHLHHVPRAKAARDGQVRALLAWLDAAPPSTGQLVMGDFNATPTEPAARRMRAAGFRSAYAAANGRDPAVTWPSGLQAPAMDTDGEPSCLDYIWVRGAVRVVGAWAWANRPAAHDPTLYPSDHLGIAAAIDVGAGPAADVTGPPPRQPG